MTTTKQPVCVRTNEPGARPVARIRHHGQYASVRIPERWELVEFLSTVKHVGRQDPVRGFEVHKQPWPLAFPDVLDGKKIVTFPVGLLPVVTHWLHEHGYDVQPEDDGIAELPAPLFIDPYEYRTPLDEALLCFVYNHKRGIVRHDCVHVSPVRLTAQVIKAWPHQRIAICTTGPEKARRTRRELNKLLGRKVDLVTGRDYQELRDPVVVVSNGMLKALELCKQDIVIATTATEFGGLVVKRELPYLGRARLYGLLHQGKQLAPFDRDLVWSHFGFEELVIPRHGQVVTDTGRDTNFPNVRNISAGYTRGIQGRTQQDGLKPSPYQQFVASRP